MLPLLYLVAAAVVLGANPFKGQTITPFDLLVSQKAWSFADPGVHVRQGQRSDTLDWLVPIWSVAREQVRTGQFPLWDDKLAGGGDLLTVSSTLFTPAFLIFAATPDPAIGFYLAILVNLAIAGLGMHLLLRRHLGWLAATTGALTFEFCGFNAAWLYWPHVFTLIWVPWLFWALHRCACRPGVGRAGLIAFFTALTSLGGFPFVSVIALEAGALYALILWAFRLKPAGEAWPFAIWYVCGTLLGLVLAAIPLLGLVYWLSHFDIGYRYGRGSYLNIHYWKQLFPPWAWEVRRVEQTMYVGAVMIALAIAAIVATAMRWRRVKPLPLFSVLLFLITAGLVFGLWPMWLIGWLPGMAFNSWSRAIGVMDIALIVLGAAALDWLWVRVDTLGWRNVMRCALLLLAAAQVTEMACFFRSFNGPVAAKDYFPSTPTIAYMQEHAGPFDSVITDRSFLMSGTLGAYGLREWLAHYFRSPALQHALHGMAKHPFHSHVASASRFPASDVKYESPIMASFNVRYVAIDAAKNPVSPKPVAPPRPHRLVALPLLPLHPHTQWFALDATPAYLEGIAVKFATYLKSDLPGTLRVSLVDSAHRTLAKSSTPAARATDNTFLYFAFNKPVPLQPGRYAFTVNYSHEAAGNPRIAAWVSTAANAGSELLVDGNPHPGTIEYRLRFAPENDNPFRRVFASGGTAVLENTRSPRGPYFLPKIQGHPDAQSARDVHVETYHAANFTLDYAGSAAGFVIVPLTANSNWQVRVNGSPAKYRLKEGVMPAVAVAGPSRITFEYHPRVLRWLVPWILALAVMVLGMLLLGRVMRRQSP